MPQENHNQPKCGYCGKVYNPYEGDRFWSGSWSVEADNGTLAHYETLCDQHHRELVRRGE